MPLKKHYYRIITINGGWFNVQPPVWDIPYRVASAPFSEFQLVGGGLLILNNAHIVSIERQVK